MPTLEITYSDEADLRRQLRAELLRHKEWLTIRELSARYKTVSNNLMSTRIKRWQERGLITFEEGVSVRRGASGRILQFKMTPELEIRLQLIDPDNG